MIKSHTENKDDNIHKQYHHTPSEHGSYEEITFRSREQNTKFNRIRKHIENQFKIGQLLIKELLIVYLS